MTLKKLLLISIITLAILLPVFSITAQSDVCPPGTDIKTCLKSGLNQVGGQTGYGANAGDVQASTISQKIGTIISYVLAFLGVIFLILVVYSGLQWMTAGGNEEKVKQARTRLINAAVGLIIVMAAYAITFFVVSKIKGSISSGTPTSTTQIFTVAHAQTSSDPLLENLKSAAETGAQYSTVDTNTVPKIIGQIVAIVLAFVAMIFFMMIIFSGVQWMTAGGNEEKVKQAKTRLINSVMGLTFVVAAYFLTWLIKVTLLGA